MVTSVGGLRERAHRKQKHNIDQVNGSDAGDVLYPGYVSVAEVHH